MTLIFCMLSIHIKQQSYVFKNFMFFLHNEDNTVIIKMTYFNAFMLPVYEFDLLIKCRISASLFL